MSLEPSSRHSYEDSCRLLLRLGYLDAGADGTIPPMRNHRPQFDDEGTLGVSFFRTSVSAGEHDLENLTLPRTDFAKSQVGPLSFRNTDLSESTLCWNDFNDVDFTDADLSECDLRASIFTEVNFVRTNMQKADLRHSSFLKCRFRDADMRGAKLTHHQGAKIDLSEKQRQEIDWQENDGEQPPGG